MSRSLRIECAGALYHVISQGDRRESIFEDDKYRRALLAVVVQGVERFDAQMLAYCLMGNHSHFVLHARSANLALLMRRINGVFIQRFNWRHGMVGHLLQGLFKVISRTIPLRQRSAHIALANWFFERPFALLVPLE